jgi:hypothetical protein
MAEMPVPITIVVGGMVPFAAAAEANA